MSPQFVDFDSDGHLDIVCGTFDGSPHVAFGNGKHWQQPETILDRRDQRIVLNTWWNHQSNNWASTERCDPDGGAPAEGHLTSCIAMDLDHDGDLDLVLGDHKSGYVYMRRNEGNATEAAFSARNEILRVAGQPMRELATVATIRAVDWNRDGLKDLMIGGMGNAFGNGTGGSVVVHLAKPGTEFLNFARTITLIAPSSTTTDQTPLRPNTGLHPDAIDFDDDGDLDLIVGGFAHWQPNARTLTAAQQNELAGLQTQRNEWIAKIRAMSKKTKEALEGLEPAAADRLRRERRQAPERVAMVEQRDRASKRILELAPQAERAGFTWLYENRHRTPTVKDRAAGGK